MKMIVRFIVFAVLVSGCAASASSIIANSGLSVAMSLGASRVFDSDLDLTFGVLPAREFVVSYENGGFGTNASFFIGYTVADSGLGVNLELQGSSFDLVRESSYTTLIASQIWNDSVKIRSVGAFANVDVHTDFGARHACGTKEVLALYAAAGVGLLKYSSIDGALVLDARSADALANFSGDSDVMFALKFKIGGEMIFKRVAALGVNAGVVFVSAADTINLGQVITTGGGVTPDTLDYFSIPIMSDGFIELKLSYFII